MDSSRFQKLFFFSPNLGEIISQFDKHLPKGAELNPINVFGF